MCPNHISGETETVHDLTPTRLTDLIDRVFENGYTPLPIKPGSKIPGALTFSGHDEGTFVLQWRNLGGWQSLQVTDASIDEWKNWSRAGLGIRGDNVVGIDIDVDDANEAHAVEAIVVDVLGVTPLRRVGRPPRPMLVYRHDGSLRKVVLAKHRDSGHKVEAIARGSQFVAFAVHPDTRRPYEWTNGHSPIDTHVDDLPEATAAKLDELSQRLAARWQCEPMPERAAEVRLGALENVRPVDSERDPMFQEFVRRGALHSMTPSAAGYYPVTCPLVHEHTNGEDDGAGYLPGNPGSFICHHGSHIDTLRRAQVRQLFNATPHGDTPTPDLRDQFEPLSDEDLEQLRPALERLNPETFANLALLQPRYAALTDSEAFVLPDPATIPLRDWLMQPGYLRADVSLLVGTGGVGKSLLVLTDAVALATGKTLLAGRVPRRAYRVAYFTAEDGEDEIDRRVAVLAHVHHITQADLGGRLFIRPLRGHRIVMADRSGAATINREFIDMFIQFLKRIEVDVVIFDPLAAINGGIENSNDSMNRIIDALRDIAARANVAVRIVHHMRKDGEDVRGSRGGGALVDGVRQADAVMTMTEEQAKRMRVPPDKRRNHFGIVDGKQNYAEPGDDQWFERASVDVGNGGDRAPVLKDYRRPPRSATRDQAVAVHAYLTEHGPQRAFHTAGDWFGWKLGELCGVLTPGERTTDLKATLEDLAKMLVRAGVMVKTTEDLPRENRTTRASPVYIAGVLPAGDWLGIY